MIVKDAETIEQALQMLAASSGGVRYSDQFAYIIVTTPGTLEYLCSRAVTRNDVAIVVPRGQEHELENYTHALVRVRKQRAIEEKRKIKEWVREHPEAVEKFERKLR